MADFLRKPNCILLLEKLENFCSKWMYTYLKCQQLYIISEELCIILRIVHINKYSCH